MFTRVQAAEALGVFGGHTRQLAMERNRSETKRIGQIDGIGC
jgi:hypothetical protein